MATTLKTMIDRLPAERRERVKARAEELIAQELTLRDLRKARDLTQQRMAEILDIGQDTSRASSSVLTCSSPPCAAM